MRFYRITNPDIHGIGITNPDELRTATNPDELRTAANPDEQGDASMRRLYISLFGVVVRAHLFICSGGFAIRPH